MSGGRHYSERCDGTSEAKDETTPTLEGQARGEFLFQHEEFYDEESE
jgi:hypothetical protein